MKNSSKIIFYCFVLPALLKMKQNIFCLTSLIFMKTIRFLLVLIEIDYLSNSELAQMPIVSFSFLKVVNLILLSIG